MPSTPFAHLVAELHSLRVTLERLRVTLDTLAQVTGDHETRMRILEHRQNQLMPIAAALTFLLGVLVTELLGRWL